MCDNLIIRHNGVSWFAKNSDREPDEAQIVVRIPAVSAGLEATVQTTWITIPQQPDRFSVLLSKPAWLWGGEMGANDQGVVIGNTAVFTRVMEKKDGLIGMDLLRLGLERSASALAAVQTIGSLLEQFGQGGICGYRDKKFRYDNSFVIADAGELWVLETAGRQWAAKKVESWTTSNCLTLGDDYDLHSADLVPFARDRGLWKSEGPLPFARTFDTRFMPFFARSYQRVATSRALLRDCVEPSTAVLAHALRHHEHAGYGWISRRNSDLCMHSVGYIRRSQSCGTQISRLAAGDEPTHLFTGTSAPCMSLLKPAGFGAYPWSVLSEAECDLQESLWFRHEKVHRRALFDSQFRKRLQEDQFAVEGEVLALIAAGDPIAADSLAASWQIRWEQAAAEQARPLPGGLYGRHWRRINKRDAALQMIQ